MRRKLLNHSILFSSLLGAALPVLATAANESAMGPIVIQADRDPGLIGEVAIEQDAGSYTVIPRERFAHRNASVAEIIESETGVQVRQSGGLGSYSSVSLRGASEQQVMVFVDSLPLNQAAGGGVDLGRLDLGQIEAIEIYRGRTPIQFGVATPGGAINIRTRRNRGGRSHQHIEGSIGSFGTTGLRIDSFGEGVFWDHALVLSAQSSDNDFEFLNKNRPFNPADPNREKTEERNNADSERASLLLRLGYRPGAQQRWEGSVSYFEQDQGLPSFSNRADSRTRLKTDNLLTQLRWQGFADAATGWDQRIRLFHSDVAETFDDRTSQVGLGAQHTRDTTTNTGIEWFTARPVGEHRFRGNLSWQLQSYESRDLISNRRSTEPERQTLAAGAEWELRLAEGRFSATPALRLLSFEDETNGQTTYKEDYLTPQIGLRYALSERTTITANAGRYIRIPSFFEQFGDRGFIKGNANLSEETSDNFDLGLEWNALHSNHLWLTRSKFGITAFASAVEDAIVYVFDARGVGRAVNLNEAEIRGLELSAALNFRSATRVEIDITAQEPENRSPIAAFDGKRLPGRFSEAYNLRIEQWLGNHTRLFYRYHAERGLFYDSPNLLPATDRDEHDIGLATDWRNWSVSLEARNLKDENFQSFNGFPEPGRSFWASLGYSFR